MKKTSRKAPPSKKAPARSSSKAPAARKGKGRAAPAKGKKKAVATKKRPAPKKPRAAAKPKRAPLAPVSAPPENPRAKALAQRMAELLLDKKATEVVVIDVRGKTSYADYFIVASGDSDRQVAAMAEHVQVELKREQNLYPVGTEGQQTGQWVLLDYGEVIAHLFLADARAFYDLEGLWADAPKEKVA